MPTLKLTKVSNDIYSKLEAARDKLAIDSPEYDTRDFDIVFAELIGKDEWEPDEALALSALFFALSLHLVTTEPESESDDDEDEDEEDSPL
jgi:hypothetical protein